MNGYFLEDGRYVEQVNPPVTRSTGKSVVKASVAPEGLNIKTSERATHEDRARVIQKLGDALSDGRIDDEVHDARVAYAQQAVTRSDASSVLMDLPGRSDTLEEQPSYRLRLLERHSEKQDNWISELEITGFATGLLGMLVGAALVALGINMLGHMAKHLGYGLPVGILGLVVVIAGGVSVGKAMKPRPGVDD